MTLYIFVMSWVSWIAGAGWAVCVGAYIGAPSNSQREAAWAWNSLLFALCSGLARGIVEGRGFPTPDPFQLLGMMPYPT